MKAIDYLKTIYPNIVENDKQGTINGNFWNGIAKLMEDYAHSDFIKRKELLAFMQFISATPQTELELYSNEEFVDGYINKQQNNGVSPCAGRNLIGLFMHYDNGDMVNKSKNQVENTNNDDKKLLLSDVRQLVCTNLNHRCTGFEKGKCKMIKAKCVFQQTCT